MLIERRRVLELALLATVSACGAPAQQTVTPPAPAPEPPSPPFPLEERSIGELRAMLERGEQTAQSLVEHYLSRIAALDRQGPALGAIMELNPDALSIAATLDQERRSGKLRGPLHGIPLLLKDNIATADRTETTAGSLALLGHKPTEDAFAVARLRAAGAVLLGKTNLSEWANIRSRHSTSGWSSRGGQCHNPYALARNPCGSSSGSAVATSVSMCAAALGTETQGSIVCPSSACGIVGVKPTVGLVSRAGVIPITHSFDTLGPMARSVRDAAELLGAMQGVDAKDQATSAARPYVARDYTAGLRENALRGARIGVARKLFGFHPPVDALMGEALEALSKLGAELVDPIDLVFPREAGALILDVMLFELKAGLNAYLAQLPPGAERRTLADIIAFNTAHAREVMPHFGQDLLRAAEERGSLDDPEYLAAIEKVRRAARDEGIDRVVEAHRLDAIVAPTGSPAWLTDHLLGDHFVGGSSTPAAMAGYPHITVPAGHIDGLPVGMSLFGAAFTEPQLLAYAFAFERETQHRRPPAIQP